MTVSKSDEEKEIRKKERKKKRKKERKKDGKVRSPSEKVRVEGASLTTP